MAIIQYSASQAGCGGGPAGSIPPNVPNPNPPVELHVCMGLNACQGHDRFGTNNCAGTGYCATAEFHVCHTLNNCRSQGGCGLFGTAEEQDKPGANDCSGQGSCAVPIQAERFSTMGENAGRSTWLAARKLFEERMTKAARRSIGSAPMPCGPTTAWLNAQPGGFGSCGSSGSKICSFGFNDKTTNSQELCEGGKISEEWAVELRPAKHHKK